MALTKVDPQLVSGAFTTDSTGLTSFTGGNVKLIAPSAGTNRTLVFQNEVGTQATLGIGSTGGTGGTGNFYLQTNAGVAVVVDSSSKVGIGTTSPSYQLHSYSNANQSILTYTQNASSGTGAYAGTESVSNTVELPLRAYSSTFNTFSHAGIALAGWAEIFASTLSGAGPQGFLIGTDSASPMVFATNNAERMRINSSGYLLVGTTSQPTNAVATAGSIVSAGSFTTFSGNLGNTTTGNSYTLFTIAAGTSYIVNINAANTCSVYLVTCEVSSAAVTNTALLVQNGANITNSGTSIRFTNNLGGNLNGVSWSATRLI